MTRLTDALDRAANRPVTADQPAADQPAPEVPAPAAELGRAWQFDADEPVQAPRVDEGIPLHQVRTNAQANSYEFGLGAVGKLVFGASPDNTTVEQYRHLAGLLHQSQADNGDRSVMISSAVAAEGKTLTATNLALTLSQSFGRRVLLVDADLRRPNMHEVFRLPNVTGLSNVLRRSQGGKLPVHQVLPKLWVLTAGKPDPDPMGSLVSQSMRELLEEAVEQFDWVIVDTPPVGLLTDANLLAAMIDRAILVVGAETTPYPLAKRAVESVGHDKILGVVFNRAKRSQMTGGYGGYSYYGGYHSKPREPERKGWFSRLRKRER